MDKTLESIFMLNTASQLKEGSQELLTEREALIASYLVCDYTVNDIARLLCRSKNTIKMHIKNMKRKCKCVTQAGFGAALKDFIKNNPQGDIKNNVRD